MTKFYPSAMTVLTVLMLTACGSADDDVKLKADMAVQAQDIPHAQLPDTVIPQDYRVNIRMDPDADAFTGVVEIDVLMTEPAQRIWLHAKDMNVSLAQIHYDDVAGKKLTQELKFTQIPVADAPSGVAYLQSESELPKGSATLTLTYETPYNQALNSAYQVKRGGEGYIVTQFEPLGAREAFPSFDEPKYKVPFTLSITAPQSDFVYANTPEIKATTLEDGWVKHDFAKTRPLPTYLVAFGAGPYDVVEGVDIPPNSVRGYPLKLRGMGAAGAGKNLDYALENTSGILTALEEYFGTPYPYEKLDLIAAPEYAFGAMENPGAIVYREYLLLLDEDAPLSQKRSHARVHAHELAHQWFGNLVTPVWWEDIWLNEAFATWMGNKATDIWQPKGNYDRMTLNGSLYAMSLDTLATTRKVREPLARSENVIDQFDSITYSKGGGVLSMFESYLGEDKFRDGVRLHMKRYADDVATGDDFFKSIADGSGNADVVDAMKSFVDQAGLPLIKAALDCGDGASCETATINLAQSRYAPLGSKTQQGQSWQIPVCAKVGYKINGASKVEKQCSLMKSKTDKMTLELAGEPEWMMPNVDGAGYYRFSLDSAGWAALIKNLDALNTREALVTQDSLFAAFRAGEVDADIFLAGQKAFAAHSQYDVASASTELLGFMKKHVASDDAQTRAALAAHVDDMFKARYAETLTKDTASAALLGPALARALIAYGGSDDLSADFAKKGAAYLGLNGTPDKDAVDGKVLSIALAETMRANGPAAYGPLLEMAENGSAFEKGAAIGALSKSPDITIADRLRALILDDNAPLTGRQLGHVLSGLLRSKTHGDTTWDWLKANFADYVNAKVPDVRKGGMPSIAGGFCSAQRRDEVQAFFTSQADVIPGYERPLAQVIERIELCAALKSAKSAELKSALGKL